MRYYAMASPEFTAQWLAHGPLRHRLGTAPVVVFDRKDDLQDGFLRTIGAAQPTGQVRHQVPGTDAFRQAVLTGLGWGVIPEAQAALGRAEGTLVDLAPATPVDVPLYWHQWKLDSPALSAVAESVARIAAEALHH
jgi:LysR family transcriptional regulator (chromosome initiation inhibitor)